MRLIGRSKLARIAGVSPAAVTKACKTQLADACHGKRLDLDHPSVRQYLEKHGVPLTVLRPEGAPDVGQLVSWTLGDIVDRFGTLQGFVDYVDVRKKIGETRKIELANDEKHRTLISRELVRTHVFGFIDATNRRLLNDTPRAIAMRLYAMAKAGAPKEDVEGLVRDQISSQLRALRDHASKILREGGTP